MLRHVGVRVAAAALGGYLGIIFLAQDASVAYGALTTASRAPICVTVTDSYYYTLFGVKMPLWVFTNHCSYAEYFYAEYPGKTTWTASGKYAPYQSVSQASTGLSAKYFHLLECPSGWTATGTNPSVCYK
jgi:hypothetical protein